MASSSAHASQRNPGLRAPSASTTRPIPIGAGRAATKWPNAAGDNRPDLDLDARPLETRRTDQSRFRRRCPGQGHQAIIGSRSRALDQVPTNCNKVSVQRHTREMGARNHEHDLVTKWRCDRRRRQRRSRPSRAGAERAMKPITQSGERVSEKSGPIRVTPAAGRFRRGSQPGTAIAAKSSKFTKLV